MKIGLSHAHQGTYDAILRHPAAHNLQWRDVRSMLGALGKVVEESDGNFRVTRNGQTLLLHPDRHKDVDTLEELKELRAFLERSDEEPTPPAVCGVNLLVVIDHRQARIFVTEPRGLAPERIVAYDPEGTGRHLHYVENDSNGQRRPEQRSYYVAIAKALRAADAILVFGGGTGASSAMDQLLSELTLHHKELAARVVGSMVVDEHHLSQQQLVAKARECFLEIASDAPTRP
ncbi:MAG: hypothetical protein AABZ53_14525 [Planctomycetota bacterium]